MTVRKKINRQQYDVKQSHSHSSFVDYRFERFQFRDVKSSSQIIAMEVVDSVIKN